MAKVLLALQIFQSFDQHSRRILKTLNNALLLVLLALTLRCQILDLTFLRLNYLCHLERAHLGVP